MSRVCIELFDQIGYDFRVFEFNHSRFCNHSGLRYLHYKSIFISYFSISQHIKYNARNRCCMLGYNVFRMNVRLWFDLCTWNWKSIWALVNFRLDHHHVQSEFGLVHLFVLFVLMAHWPGYIYLRENGVCYSETCAIQYGMARQVIF